MSNVLKPPHVQCRGGGSIWRLRGGSSSHGDANNPEKNDFRRKDRKQDGGPTRIPQATLRKHLSRGAQMTRPSGLASLTTPPSLLSVPIPSVRIEIPVLDRPAREEGVGHADSEDSAGSRGSRRRTSAIPRPTRGGPGATRVYRSQSGSEESLTQSSATLKPATEGAYALFPPSTHDHHRTAADPHPRPFDATQWRQTVLPADGQVRLGSRTPFPASLDYQPPAPPSRHPRRLQRGHLAPPSASNLAPTEASKSTGSGGAASTLSGTTQRGSESSGPRQSSAQSLEPLSLFSSAEGFGTGRSNRAQSSLSDVFEQAGLEEHSSSSDASSSSRKPQTGGPAGSDQAGHWRPSTCGAYSSSGLEERSEKSSFSDDSSSSKEPQSAGPVASDQDGHRRLDIGQTSSSTGPVPLDSSEFISTASRRPRTPLSFLPGPDRIEAPAPPARRRPPLQYTGRLVQAQRSPPTITESDEGIHGSAGNGQPELFPPQLRTDITHLPAPIAPGSRRTIPWVETGVPGQDLDMTGPTLRLEGLPPEPVPRYIEEGPSQRGYDGYYPPSQKPSHATRLRRTNAVSLRDSERPHPLGDPGPSTLRSSDKSNAGPSTLGSSDKSDPGPSMQQSSYRSAARVAPSLSTVPPELSA